METLKRIDTILDSMKTEPLSYIVPMVMSIALECKDYQGYSLLAHWNCPLCDEVSANAVQRDEIVSALIQEGLSKEDANELEFQTTKQYMNMKSIGGGDILAHSVKEMEQWISGYESVMSSPPHSKEKIVQLNERKKQIEQQYELLRSYIVSKLTSYRRKLKKKEEPYIVGYTGKSNTEKKKYQIFVSSTYSDLKEERAAVMQCLLEMNCIPVGMEQFPASNMNQMDYIRMMLDDCDYYVLVLGGRYGSLDTDGTGFTEKEYDYAIKHGIPVMSFVVDDIGKLPSAKCEITDLGRNKLKDFRTKVCSGKLVKFYSDIGSLKAAVAVSLNRCIQDFPAIGWIRGNTSSPVEGVDEEDDLKAKVLKILEEHTTTDADIDDMFMSAPRENQDGITQPAVQLDGMRAFVEEIIKVLPSGGVKNK